MCAAGCAVRPAPRVWRLTERQLIPPGLIPRGVTRAIFAPGSGKLRCVDTSGPVEFRKRRLKLKVSSEALARQASGWLGRWAFEVEQLGCVAKGFGFPLAREISESVALAPNDAWRLLSSTDPRGTWVDVGPGVGLQVVTPILRDPTSNADPLEGATINGLSVTVRASENLIGFETTLYEVGPGRDLTVRSVLRNVNGVVERVARPTTDHLQFAPGVAMYRLVYKAGQTEFTALLIAARNPAELDIYSAGASCSPVPAGYCVAIPRGAGINPIVPVTVNGVETVLQWGATLGEAVRQAGWRGAALPPGLKVARLHRGRPVAVEFAAGDTSILKLVALGGETISWDALTAPVRSTDNWEFAPNGRMVDLGGRRVHLYCTGAGSPVVMIVGAGFSFDWSLVQPEIAKLTRVCTYDPAGTAWSDPGPGLDCQARVDEIRAVLSRERIGGPYILAGLSISALTARLFAAEYPRDVAGIAVLVHAFINPGSSPRNTSRPAADSPDSPPALLEMTPIVVTAEDDPGFSRLPDAIRKLHRWAASQRPVMPSVENARACTAAVDAATEGRARPLDDLPLVVVSTANDTPNYGELQQQLLALSTNSRQMTAEKSFHAIEMSEPDIAVEAIRQLVETVRSRNR